MLEEIKKIENSFLQEIERVKTLEELEALRIKYLGRKSFISQAFSQIPNLEREQRVELGKVLNATKEKIVFLLDEKRKTLSMQEEKIDLTIPPFPVERGIKHVLTQVNGEICGIFEKLGFIIIEGKEIEDEWHNFEALNIPLEHPSRDVFDTFYLDLPPISKDKGKLLLRSHTSPSQIRVMKKMRPPLAVVSPGRVYRPDKVDASHSFMFHQIEGFCVDRNINFSHLKGVLFYFAKSFFSSQVKLRFRPHYFPFTEPSAEVDLSCILCEGRGCSVCSYKGWVEILGCGMIHPEVLKACKISPKEYQGFAFGMGIERIAMLKYRINDIRLFFENDLRFLEQFYEV
ncbi:MAG: phenylalanine--tRNA ligase subunit alpha [Candidatus Omnitrophota bacterium]|nr:MAG: phenylalanine--tRNA ligase subunit alpha [Candidatus Omnitrophota bacterium]